MQENIRKFVESAEHPILAAPLFLRQGWETTKASPRPCICLWPFRSPRQNVAKSVAKARKNTQATTSHLQPHQQHTRHFSQKTPLPPLFGQKRP